MATNWMLDPAHTVIQFKVRHMMIATVTGEFVRYDAKVETEGDDFSKAKVEFWAETGSVDTHNEQRDGHLRSADFFDSENFPRMTFVSTRIEDVDHDGSFTLYGNMTIKNITKEVKLGVEFGGVQKDPWGNTKAGLTLSGKINRKDFGLEWNVPLEAGGLLVSEDVRLALEVQLAKQA